MDEGQSIHVGVTGFSAAITAILAFFGKRALTDIKETQERLNKHELEDVSKYVTRVELQPTLERIHDRLDKIYDKVANDR